MTYFGYNVHFKWTIIVKMLSQLISLNRKRRPSTPTEGKEGRKTTRKYERKDKDKTKRRQNAGEEKSLKMLRKLAAQSKSEIAAFMWCKIT